MITMTVTTKHPFDLHGSGTSTIQIKRIKQLAIEIFKTVINSNLDFMKNIFTSKQNAQVRFTCQKSQYSNIR